MKVHVLSTRTGGALDVCTSMRALRKAVDHWMKIYPDKVLCYETYIPNRIESIDGWEWCYIPKNTRPSTLSASGAMVPDPKFRGINLVGIEWTHDIQDANFERELASIPSQRRDDVKQELNDSESEWVDSHV